MIEKINHPIYQNNVVKINEVVDKINQLEQAVENMVGPSSSSPDSTTIGTGSVVTGTESVAIGNSSATAGDNVVAVGNNSTASGNNSMAIGNAAEVNGQNSIGIGQNSSAEGENVVAVGSSSKADASGATATGGNSTASGANASVYGSNATVTGNNAVGIGAATNVTQNNSIGIGALTSVTQSNSIGIGTSTSITQSNSVGIGSGTTVTSTGSVGVGTEANVTGNNSVAIGNDSTVTGQGSTAIGANTAVSSTNSVAIGQDSSTSDNNVISVGHASGDKDSNNNTYTTTLTRRIVNVSAGVNASDAATVGQLQEIRQVPAGGSDGQILRWASSGTAVWGSDLDTKYIVATPSANGLMSSADKTKLNGIENNANNYTHPTTSGNKHIPSGGSSGQILKWSADGTAVWGNEVGQTYSNFVKSGSTAAAGLVPAPPTTAGTTKYLCEDGTWTVPSGTSNTSYTHPTSSGYKHIPAGGSSGQILRWSADGTAVWSTENDTKVGSAITLTGYAKASSYTAVAASDTVNAAIGKLEKALETVSSSNEKVNKSGDTMTGNLTVPKIILTSGIEIY